MSDDGAGTSLRRALSEIVSLSALPAVWNGFGLRQIVDDVADVLLKAVDLDFVYAGLSREDPAPVTAIRSRRTESDKNLRITSVARKLLVSGDAMATVVDPADAGRSLRMTVIPGDHSDLVIVAASARRNFPTEVDRLLLTLVVNQANIVINRKRVEHLEDMNTFLKAEIDDSRLMGSVIGVSKAMRAVLSDVDKVASTEATVLITGETGTGKELIAREIHRRSPRAHGPMICVHAASFSPSLIASELFGHERGAFTGAMQRRIGRFELASNGTIFLDEIGDLSPEIQVALLRVLQERTFERVGGSQTLHTNARVIAATNRDLQKSVAEGTFRGDLYYRLSVFPIHIPALRERPEDIPPLVQHFTSIFSKRFGKNINGISSASMQRLREYGWPGNVRELENVIERAVILARSEELVIPPAFFPKRTDPAGGGSLPLRVDEMEKSAIEKALAESGGRVGGPLGAATRLGLRPTTLYSKLRKHHIEPARFKRSR
ncbi:MAG TPA: sigma-54 dependent transcriptional regulator [Thermoanaerobaculia bacterium]|jgi:formate hydrogenlyase transcriptional activator|nr:sigma-54 dependent transcriptional regulator [Thermoanaerobaculia bacterium]